MQASLVGIGLLLGLDSLFACVGSRMVSPSRARTRGLILGFAVCDGLASLAGASLGADRLGTFLRWGDWLAPVAIGLYGLFVIALAGRSRWPGPGASGDVGCPWVLLLPLCLSLDNLVVGFGPAAPGAAGLSEAVLVGGLSGMGRWSACPSGPSCGAIFLVGRNASAAPSSSSSPACSSAVRCSHNPGIPDPNLVALPGPSEDPAGRTL